MNRKKWISHGLALCIGFFVARAISVEQTDREVTQSNAEVSQALPTKYSIRPLVVAPDEVLNSLASYTMKSNERYSLKYDIYSEWVKKDPLAFLEYFENRPHTYNAGSHELAFKNLAQTQPEALLAYAKRTGCSEALSALVQYADPDVVIELIKNQNEGRFPQDELKKLVIKGLEIDPKFYLKLLPILGPDSQKIVLNEVVSVMKSDARVDDLFALFKQYSGILEPEEIGESAGSLMVNDVRELNRLDSLDEIAKQAAVKEMFYSFNYTQVSENGQRQILATLASRGLLDDYQSEVYELMMEDDPEEISPESAVAWKDWAVSLPSSSGTKPIQLCTAMKWSIVSKVKGDEILKLPEGNLRDGALVGGFVTCAMNNNFSDAKNMVESISDAETKARMLGYLSQLIKGEEPEDFNPFGIEVE